MIETMENVICEKLKKHSYMSKSETKIRCFIKHSLFEIVVVGGENKILFRLYNNGKLFTSIDDDDNGNCP